jgi:hypothetical protein
MGFKGFSFLAFVSLCLQERTDVHHSYLAQPLMNIFLVAIVCYWVSLDFLEGGLRYGKLVGCRGFVLLQFTVLEDG